jgi:hypothetical protein
MNFFISVEPSKRRKGDVYHVLERYKDDGDPFEKTRKIAVCADRDGAERLQELFNRVEELELELKEKKKPAAAKLSPSKLLPVPSQRRVVAAAGSDDDFSDLSPDEREVVQKALAKKRKRQRQRVSTVKRFPAPVVSQQGEGLQEDRYGVIAPGVVKTRNPDKARRQQLAEMRRLKAEEAGEEIVTAPSGRPLAPHKVAELYEEPEPEEGEEAEVEAEVETAVVAEGTGDEDAAARGRIKTDAATRAELSQVEDLMKEATGEVP